MNGNEWDDASFFSKWTYSVVNILLNKGMQAPLQFDDLMKIPHQDTAAELGKTLKEEYMRSKQVCILIN